MSNALKDSLNNGDIINCRKNTKDSLVLRNLCQKNGELTHEGKVLAIAFSPLKKQAETLSLKIKKIEYGCKNYPKIKIKNYLSNFFDYTNPDHYKAIVSSETLRQKIFPEILIGNMLLELDEYNMVCFDEGSSIILLLSCMCYGEICKVWDDYNQEKYNDNDNRDIAYCTLGGIKLLALMNKKLGFYENLSQKLIKAVKSSHISDIENSFDKLKAIHPDIKDDNFSNKNCIGINKQFITSLYYALGNESLTNIIKLYLSDPNSFGKGWPDITALTKDNSVKLIEIKTTDKLHISQIITFTEIAKYIQIEILKVVNV
ncbi:MAG: hypothetical protein KAX05_14210 [Bacteroidales bacterium]|nr:hypothetical protein [Bacteroidales bacterium]